MIVTKLTEKALGICLAAHAEQVDLAGNPYYEHPVHLAEQMDDEATTCAALLHDVIEDTDTTLDDITLAGMPDAVVEAVGLLTHKRGTPYMDYIEGLADNPIAKKVKLADLEHNSDLSRLPEVTERDLKRIEKYKRAIELLKDR